MTRNGVCGERSGDVMLAWTALCAVIGKGWGGGVVWMVKAKVFVHIEHVLVVRVHAL